jgi:hypothetical protein
MGLDQAAAAAIVGLGMTVGPTADFVARRYCLATTDAWVTYQVDPKLVLEPGGGAGIRTLGGLAPIPATAAAGHARRRRKNPKFSAPPA